MVNMKHKYMKYMAIRNIHYYRPQTKFAKVMFSQASVSGRGSASRMGLHLGGVWQTPPPPPPTDRRILRDMVNERAVRILLESILVTIRNEVAKATFLQVCVCPRGGGGCLVRREVLASQHALRQTPRERRLQLRTVRILLEWILFLYIFISLYFHAIRLDEPHCIIEIEVKIDISFISSSVWSLLLKYLCSCSGSPCRTL